MTSGPASWEKGSRDPCHNRQPPSEQTRCLDSANLRWPRTARPGHGVDDGAPRRAAGMLRIGTVRDAAFAEESGRAVEGLPRLRALPVRHSLPRGLRSQRPRSPRLSGSPPSALRVPAGPRGGPRSSGDRRGGLPASLGARLAPGAGRPWRSRGALGPVRRLPPRFRPWRFREHGRASGARARAMQRGT